MVYGRWSGEIQWIGVALQKNSLGELCLMSAFVLVWTLVGRWRGLRKSVGKYQTSAEVALLVMTLWLLKGPSAWAASATSMVALGVGLTAFVGLLWMKYHRIDVRATACMVITGGIMFVGVMEPLKGGSTLTGFTSALGRDATLTGRTEIWRGLLPDVMRKPFLGYGFSGFWSSERIAEHQIGEAHNGYLDMWLQLGAVGLFFTAMFFLSFARRAQRTLRVDFDWGSLSLCFVLMTVTESIAESAIDSFNRQLMAVVLFLSISGVGNVRRSRRGLASERAGSEASSDVVDVEDRETSGVVRALMLE